MINNAASTPKVYSNHANHPGHTTAAFNKQKVAYAGIHPAPQPAETTAALRQPSDASPGEPGYDPAYDTSTYKTPDYPK
jgi:hypothetical protein